MHGYLAVSSRRRSPARPSTPLATPCSSRARWTYATSAPWPCQCCDSTTLLPARGIPAACGCTPCMWRRMSPRTLWPASTRWIPPCRTRWGSLPPACLGERSHPAFAQSIQRLWMHSTWYLTTNNPSQEHEINILHFTRSQIAVYCCIVLYSAVYLQGIRGASCLARTACRRCAEQGNSRTSLWGHLSTSTRGRLWEW